MKPWHLNTHEEKIAKFQTACQYCGKKYVDHVAKYVHELKCRKASPR